MDYYGLFTTTQQQPRSDINKCIEATLYTLKTSQFDKICNCWAVAYSIVSGHTLVTLQNMTISNSGYFKLVPVQSEPDAPHMETVAHYLDFYRQTIDRLQKSPTATIEEKEIFTDSKSKSIIKSLYTYEELSNKRDPRNVRLFWDTDLMMWRFIDDPITCS